jgi:hypothetical protein
VVPLAHLSACLAVGISRKLTVLSAPEPASCGPDCTPRTTPFPYPLEGRLFLARRYNPQLDRPVSAA